MIGHAFFIHGAINFVNEIPQLFLSQTIILYYRGKTFVPSFFNNLPRNVLFYYPGTLSNRLKLSRNFIKATIFSYKTNFRGNYLTSALVG